MRAEKAALEATVADLRKKVVAAPAEPPNKVAADPAAVAEANTALTALKATSDPSAPLPTASIAPTARKLWLAQADEAIAAAKPEGSSSTGNDDSSRAELDVKPLEDFSGVPDGSPTPANVKRVTIADGSRVSGASPSASAAAVAVDRPRLELTAGQPVAVMTPDKWVPDSVVVICQNSTCKREFTVLNRKHHCRL